MSLELILTNIGYTVAVFTTIVIAIVVFLKSEQRALKILFILLSIAVATFELSHMFAINALDPYVSRQIMNFNTANIFIICIDFHFMFYVLGIWKKKKWQVFAFYAAGLSLFIFYITNPEKFLLLPSPKLYLPNYYNPGSYYYLLVILVVSGFVIILSNLYRAYRATTDVHEMKRIAYYTLGHLFAYIFGLSAQFLTYNIPFDPIWSVFFCLYTLCFAYAMIKYDLMEIHVIAKHALAYAFIAVVGGMGITIISYSNIWIVQQVPGFPTWLLPLISSVVAIIIAEFIFWEIKQVDVLKYEFINIVTHKFRTPLTYINWATNNLRGGNLSQEDIVQNVEKIEVANQKLVELTDILVSTSNSEDKAYLYNFKKCSLEKIMREEVAAMADKIKEKNLTISFTVDDTLPAILIDEHKIRFALQIILENAIIYNTDGGRIDISIKEQYGKKVILQMTDTGIGIPDNELPYIFSKFYRSDKARRRDTEGVGLGLYIVKNVLDRHDAKIKAISGGNGRGTTLILIFKK